MAYEKFGFGSRLAALSALPLQKKSMGEREGNIRPYTLTVFSISHEHRSDTRLYPLSLIRADLLKPFPSSCAQVTDADVAEFLVELTPLLCLLTQMRDFLCLPMYLGVVCCIQSRESCALCARLVFLPPTFRNKQTSKQMKNACLLTACSYRLS